jgi:hypothetical protein
MREGGYCSREDGGGCAAVVSPIDGNGWAVAGYCRLRVAKAWVGGDNLRIGGGGG